MKYVYIDGDNIGLRIEQCFLNNDEQGLAAINLRVNKAIIKIASYLNSINYEVIFSGADGIISKGENLDVSKLLKEVRKADVDLTFSIGVGSGLNACYIALRFAKSFKKDIAIDYSDDSKFIVFE